MTSSRLIGIDPALLQFLFESDPFRCDFWGYSSFLTSEKTLKPIPGSTLVRKLLQLK